MKVMFQVEGPTDEVTLVELVGKTLGRPIEPQKYQKRVGGIDEVFRTLEKCVWQAWNIGCHGAVIGVDADDSTPHDLHREDSPADCRYCEVLRRLPSLPDRPPSDPLRFAVFVPVQAIEAWLLHFATAIGKHTPGAPQAINRHEAKRLLWGTLNPDRAIVEDVCGSIFPSIDAATIAQLAERQSSFRRFRESVTSWPRPNA